MPMDAQALWTEQKGRTSCIPTFHLLAKQTAILLCHEIINNPANVKAAIGGRAGIGFPFKNLA